MNKSADISVLLEKNSKRVVCSTLSPHHANLLAAGLINSYNLCVSPRPEHADYDLNDTDVHYEYTLRSNSFSLLESKHVPENSFV